MGHVFGVEFGASVALRALSLTNSDCTIVLAAPRKSLTECFYKNADADEMIFIHSSCGSIIHN